jgi:hypothetical protein
VLWLAFTPLIQLQREFIENPSIRVQARDMRKVHFWHACLHTNHESLKALESKELLSKSKVFGK